MDHSAPVTEIMTRDLVTVGPNDSLGLVEELLQDSHFSHIPVVEGGRLLGVISHSDIMKISVSDLNDDDETIETVIYNIYTIPQVMTKNPVVVDVSCTIKETAALLSKQSFHSLPVVDNDQLVGIVTSTDLINYLLKLYENSENKE